MNFLKDLFTNKDSQAQAQVGGRSRRRSRRRKCKGGEPLAELNRNDVSASMEGGRRRRGRKSRKSRRGSRKHTRRHRR